MKALCTFFLLALTSGISLSQIIIFEDNFDTYTVGSGVAYQSLIWETWTSTTGGGANDALVSDEHALSGTQSMKIVNGKDMIYPFNNITTGYLEIEFDAFFHDQGYFNFQHAKGSNWAVDIYLDNSNQIKYLEEDGIANSQVVGTYANDVWTNFRFAINLNLDTILFYVDDVLLHASKFSNSLDYAPSINLDVFNVYGLAGFNGVTTSYFYLDNFKVTDMSASTGISNDQISDIQIYPNPASQFVKVFTTDLIEQITLFDLTGKQILHEFSIDQNNTISLVGLNAGVYIIKIKSNVGIIEKKLVIQ